MRSHPNPSRGRKPRNIHRGGKFVARSEVKRNFVRQDATGSGVKGNFDEQDATGSEFCKRQMKGNFDKQDATGSEVKGNFDKQDATGSEFRKRQMKGNFDKQDATGPEVKGNFDKQDATGSEVRKRQMKGESSCEADMKGSLKKEGGIAEVFGKDLSMPRNSLRDVEVVQGNTPANLGHSEGDWTVVKEHGNAGNTRDDCVLNPERRITELEGLYSKSERDKLVLEQEIRDLTSRMLAAQQEMSNFFEITEEVRAWRDRCAHLDRQLSAARQEVDNSRNGINQTQEELHQMKVRNEILHKAVQDLERQRGELVASSGFFDSNSGATPNQLQKLANKLRDLLPSFSKKLMVSMRTALQESKMTIEALEKDLVPGVKLSSKSDMKFVYQKFVACICFHGFEAEDYGILDCLPVKLDRGQTQAEYLHHFETFNSLSVAQLCDKVQKFESTRQPCDSKACVDAGCCSCGQASFLPFVAHKINHLQYQLVEILKIIQAPEHGLWWTDALKKELVQLLSCVWLAHRLSFAFEPPATLLKIRGGHDFDPQYMVNVGTRDDADEDVQLVPKVSFMILPGFRVANSVIRAQVYVI